MSTVQLAAGLSLRNSQWACRLLASRLATCRSAAIPSAAAGAAAACSRLGRRLAAAQEAQGAVGHRFCAWHILVGCRLLGSVWAAGREQPRGVLLRKMGGHTSCRARQVSSSVRCQAGGSSAERLGSAQLMFGVPRSASAVAMPTDCRYSSAGSAISSQVAGVMREASRSSAGWFSGQRGASAGNGSFPMASRSSSCHPAGNPLAFPCLPPESVSLPATSNPSSIPSFPPTWQEPVGHVRAARLEQQGGAVQELGELGHGQQHACRARAEHMLLVTKGEGTGIPLWLYVLPHRGRTAVCEPTALEQAVHPFRRLRLELDLHHRVREAYNVRVVQCGAHFPAEGQRIARRFE